MFSWFWIYMLIMDIIIPLTMIGFGRAFMKKAPGKINDAFGYRTRRSMKNRETWEYAHKYFGRLWFLGGSVLLPLSVIAMLFVRGGDHDRIGVFGAVLMAVQMLFMIGAIFPTERALKKEFDEE